MKKLTVLAAAILVASGANAATVYKTDDLTLDIGGRAEARADFFNAEAKTANGTEQDVNDASRFRLNVKASTDLNDEWTGFGFIENEYNKNGLSETRHLYVGVADETTEIRYGKTDGALGQVTDMVDFFQSYSGQTADKLLTADRTNNQLLVTQQVGVFTVKGNLNGGGQQYKSGTDSATIDYGMGISAVADLGAGFTLGAGYAYESVKDLSAANGAVTYTDDATLDEFVTGVGYTVGDLYVSAGMNERSVSFKNVDKSTLGWALAGQYGLTDQLILRATYATQDAEVGDDDSWAAGEIEYDFNNNFMVYTGLEYGLAGAKEDAISGRLAAKLTF
ncbi:TPA: porin [Vibrio harveyi]